MSRTPPKKQVIGISGSRTLNRPNKDELDRLIYLKLKEIVLKYDKNRTLFVSGAASSGADKQIELVCQDLGYEYDGETYKPDFSKGYAMWKYFERNQRMAEAIDEGYCLWDGRSTGTKHFMDCLAKLIARGKPKRLHVITFDILLSEADWELQVT